MNDNNILHLTTAQSEAQNIQTLINWLSENASGPLNQLVNALTGSQDPQALFDIWDTQALSKLLALKKIASGVEALSPGVVKKLANDFAKPEMSDGRPTGRLIYTAPKDEAQ